MPVVTVSELVEAPIEEVWAAVCNVGQYPAIMDCVRAVTVREEGPDWSLLDWSVDLDGSTLNWTELQRRSAAEFRITSEQREGDLERLDGSWRLERLDASLTRASLHVSFEIGIPMLSELLDPLAAQALEDNARLMLRSVGAAAVRAGRP